jgi:protein gp37
LCARLIKRANRARPVRKEWVLTIRDQCRRADEAFYFKQWGGTRKHANGRTLDGRTYDAMPSAADRPAVPALF